MHMAVPWLTLIYLPILIKCIKSLFATEYIVFLAVYQHKKLKHAPSSSSRRVIHLFGANPNSYGKDRWTALLIQLQEFKLHFDFSTS